MLYSTYSKRWRAVLYLPRLDGARAWRRRLLNPPFVVVVVVVVVFVLVRMLENNEGGKNEPKKIAK